MLRSMAILGISELTKTGENDGVGSRGEVYRFFMNIIKVSSVGEIQILLAIEQILMQERAKVRE